MILLLGAISQGLIYGLLAIGVYITFRIFSFPDITADGTITLGGAVTAVLLVAGWSAPVALLVAMIAGALAGMITAMLNTKFKIHSLLAGILVMTGLYSINLRIMGKSNTPLLDQPTIYRQVESTLLTHFSLPASVSWSIWQVPIGDLIALSLNLVVVVIVGMILWWFFQTHLGLAMCATGDNEHMIRALGVNTDRMKIMGVALSNAMIALSGGLLSQAMGFADVQMGIGMVVWGLASVIIGETLVGARSLGFAFISAVLGAVLFRLMLALALQQGLDPRDLKLVTAIFVAAALVLPKLTSRFNDIRTRRSSTS